MAKKKGKKSDADALDVDAEVLDTKASVARHPRARRQIRTIRGWAGLIAFALGTYLSAQAQPIDIALIRGLGFGIAAYLLAWLVAVIAWRQIVVAEIETLRRRLIERAEAERAEQEAAAAAAAADMAPTAEPSFS